MAVIYKINGNSYPPPFREPTYETQRLVQDARSTNGVVVAQPIGVELEKFTQEWKRLPAETWEAILREKSRFYSSLTYYSWTRQLVVTRYFYWGNSSSKVFRWTEIDGIKRPLEYIDCKLNLIDCGGNPFTGEAY